MTLSLGSLADDTAPDAGFVVDLDGFTGPLDLLLHLVREEQIDIADIPVARIADQFLKVIHALGLNQAADYLEMAGRLIRLKAQLLLPRHGDEEGWEDPRAELVRRLLEYQQMREVVDLLERRGEERRHQFPRRFIATAADITPLNAPLSLSLGELLAAVDRVLRTTKEPKIHEVIPRALDVAGAMTTVRAVLAMRRGCRWSDLVARDAEPWQILSVLLALLEMAKLGELRIAQHRPFASVEIQRDAVSEAA